MGTKNDPGQFDCYGAAEPDEPIFILRATDQRAPLLVRIWADIYRAHKRQFGCWDQHAMLKYSEAINTASHMEAWHDARRGIAVRHEPDCEGGECDCASYVPGTGIPAV